MLDFRVSRGIERPLEKEGNRISERSRNTSVGDSKKSAWNTRTINLSINPSLSTCFAGEFQFRDEGEMKIALVGDGKKRFRCIHAF